MKRLFAAAYRGRHVASATPVDVSVVTAPPNKPVFVVQKRRWVVERTLSLFSHNRRISGNHERNDTVAVAFVVLADAMVLVRRVAAASTT